MRNNALKNSENRLNPSFIEALNPLSDNELNQTMHFDGVHERKSSADYLSNKY